MRVYIQSENAGNSLHDRIHTNKITTSLNMCIHSESQNAGEITHQQNRYSVSFNHSLSAESLS